MDTEIALLAVDPRGFFTRRDAIGVGLMDRDLTNAVRRGALLRLRHGVYAGADHHRQRSEAERHAVMTRAAISAQRGSVAAIGPSAAVLQGLPVYGCDLSVVHLVRLDAGASRSAAGVRHHIVLGDLADHLVERDGLTVTTPTRTAWDVARFFGIEAGVVTADAVLHRDPGLIDDLNHLCHEHRYQPRARRAMVVVRLADGGAESPGESVTRIGFYRHHIPRPVLQFEVFGADGVLLGQSDFGWPDHSHLGEFDGKIKYGRLLRNGESPSDVVFREKVREDRMRGRRYGMSRFVWASVMHSGVRRSMAELAVALEQSRRLYGSH